MAHQQSLHPEKKDELLRLLADRHRRAVLSYFRNSSEDVASVRDLASEISERERGGDDQSGIRLQHSILPRLADASVVDYDRRTDTIRYRGQPELEELMRSIAHH